MKKILLLLGVYGLTCVCSSAFADESEPLENSPASVKMFILEEEDDGKCESRKKEWAEMKASWNNLRTQLEAVKNDPQAPNELKNKAKKTLKEMHEWMEKKEKHHKKWIKRKYEKLEHKMKEWMEFKENLDKIAVDNKTPDALKDSINAVEKQMKEMHEKMEKRLGEMKNKKNEG